jgi:hypothetical protein
MLHRLYVLKDLADLTQPAVEEILAKAPQKTKTAKSRSETTGTSSSGVSKSKKSCDTPSSRGGSSNGAVFNGESVESSSNSQPTNYILKGKNILQFF